jgi:hypothetical protein
VQNVEGGRRQERFWKERMDFVEFIKNLRALTADLPPRQEPMPSDEDSEVEAGPEETTSESGDGERRDPQGQTE